MKQVWAEDIDLGMLCMTLFINPTTIPSHHPNRTPISFMQWCTQFRRQNFVRSAIVTPFLFVTGMICNSFLRQVKATEELLGKIFLPGKAESHMKRQLSTAFKTPFPLILNALYEHPRFGILAAT